MLGVKLLVVVGKDGQSGNRFFVSVEESVKVDEHPFGKILFIIALYFNVYQNPLHLTLQCISFNEFVNKARVFKVLFGIKLLEFFIQKFKSPVKVNVFIGIFQKESQKKLLLLRATTPESARAFVVNGISLRSGTFRNKLLPLPSIVNMVFLFTLSKGSRMRKGFRS